MGDAATLAAEFEYFGATQCRGRSPLYEHLCLRLGAQPSVLGLLDDAAPGQRRPTLLLAAVHDLVLAEPALPLGAWYPSVGGARAPDDDAVAAFVELCADRRDDILARITSESTQTNEVRRCAALLLGVSGVAERLGGAVALLDVGASAGLNLLLDRYRYNYSGVAVGAPEADVLITVSVLGDRRPPVPAATPPISWRLGLDLAPLDVRDARDIQWLRALVWPDAVEERARLDAALVVAAADPPLVVRGDATSDLGRAIASAPDVPLVVTHTTLFTYLTAAQRAAVVSQIRAAGRDRRVIWMPLEAGVTLVDLHSRLTPDDAADRTRLVLAVEDSAQEMGARVLARVGAYGQDLRWVDADERASR